MCRLTVQEVQYSDISGAFRSHVTQYFLQAPFSPRHSAGLIQAISSLKIQVFWDFSTFRTLVVSSSSGSCIRLLDPQEQVKGRGTDFTWGFLPPPPKKSWTVSRVSSSGRYTSESEPSGRANVTDKQGLNGTDVSESFQTGKCTAAWWVPIFRTLAKLIYTYHHACTGTTLCCMSSQRYKFPLYSLL